MSWGSAAGAGGDQADSRSGTGAGCSVCDEADLGHGDSVGGVGDGGAGLGGTRSDGGDGARDLAATGSSNAGRRYRGSHCGDQSDGGWNRRDDAWVFGDPGSADSGEVGQSGLDLFLGGTPSLNAGNDFAGEFAVWTEAGGVTV